MNVYEITPYLSNSINAVLYGFFAFQLVVMPASFIAGGSFFKPWAKDLPVSHDHRLYYLMRCCGFMMSTLVFCTMMAPDSLMVAMTYCIANALTTLHWCYATCTGSRSYARHRPDGMARLQWYGCALLQLFMFIISFITLVGNDVNLEQSLPWITDWEELAKDIPRTISSPQAINLIGMTMMLIFSTMIFLIPRCFFSTFWEDVEDKPSQMDVEANEIANGAPISRSRPSFLGFTLVDLHGAEYWWLRNLGILLTSLALPGFVHIDSTLPAYKEYLWTTTATYGFGIMTLFHMCILLNSPYRGIGAKHLILSWIPNLAVQILVTLLFVFSLTPA